MSAVAEQLEPIPFDVREPEPGWHRRSELCYMIDSWLKSTVPKGRGKHAAFQHLRPLYTGYLESEHVLKLVAVDPEFPTLVVGWLVRVPPEPGCAGPVMEAWHTKTWAEPFEELILEVLREVAYQREEVRRHG